MTDQMLKDEVVIACDPSAIPTEEREQWIDAGKQIYAAVQEIHELPDGYQFRLPADPALLLKVADYITTERLCCPFWRFTLEVEPDGGPFWLSLTGGAGVKKYLRSALETSDLIDERVTTKAGLRKA